MAIMKAISFLLLFSFLFFFAPFFFHLYYDYRYHRRLFLRFLLRFLLHQHYIHGWLWRALYCPIHLTRPTLLGDGLYPLCFRNHVRVAGRRTRCNQQ